MMKNKITIVLVLILAAFADSADAQHNEYRIKAGFNIGGTSPLPLPAEIRKLESYSPTMSFSIEGNIVHWYTDKWAVMSGIRLETKGMNAGARVKNYTLTMDISDGDEPGRIHGRFTGHVETRVKNEYVTIPILALRQVSPRWELKAGPFFSYLIEGGFSGSAYDGYIRDGDPTGDKVGVESATYNFDGDLNRFNWGAEFGAEWKAYRHLSVYADLTWSFNSIFKKGFQSIGFDMYNIYLNVGFGYRF